MSLPAHLTNVDDVLLAFIESMPPAYPQIFERQDMQEHAAIIAQRGAARAHVALWRELPGGTCILCVVADDVPGLLSLVSTVFVSQQLDVTSAQIFCRPLPDGRMEAVDFFWVRRGRASALPHPLEPAEVARVSKLLSSLVAEQQLARELATRELQRVFPLLPVGPRVYFDPRSPDDGGAEVVLNIVTPDRPGLLLAITLTLVQLGLEVTASELHTREGVASDRFKLRDNTGVPLTAERLAEVRTRIVAALKLEDAAGLPRCASPTRNS
jgi:UTP:GlnB (protein PII) uridylyltransferase